MGNTLGSQMAARRTVGFDYLRVVLALSVMAWHSLVTTVGPVQAEADIAGSWVYPIRLIMPLFFALSGFLVAASLERTPRLRDFLFLRLIRIFPALIVENLLSAFVLGLMLTTVSWTAYFHDPDFWRYLLNIFGYIHYYLPGVFEGNIFPRTVNASLWTVPYELECYIALSVLFLAGIIRRGRFLFAALVFITIVYLFWLSRQTLGDRVAVPGRSLPIYFLAGVFLYTIRARVPTSLLLSVLALLLSLAMMIWLPAAGLASLPVAYAAAALGCTAPPRIRWVLSGDYSYGLYLYAFPIQQTVEQMNPQGGYLSNFVLAVVGTALFAAFSWHCIEKHALKLKKLVRPSGRAIGVPPAHPVAA